MGGRAPPLNSGKIAEPANDSLRAGSGRSTMLERPRFDRARSANSGLYHPQKTRHVGGFIANCWGWIRLCVAALLHPCRVGQDLEGRGYLVLGLRWRLRNQ
jgi:hypothetical protein